MDLKIFKKCSEKGGILYQIIMTVLINIPTISFGLTMGWLSPNSLLLQSVDGISEEPFSDEAISWMASVTFLAAIPAVFLYWYAADIWGRKPALICSSIPFAICWTLKLCSVKPWVLITARAIAGLGSSGCYVVVPLYVKEISQDSIRGALGSVIILAQNFGFLTMYILSDFFNYRAILWGCLILSVVHVVVFIFMPESPSFLVTKDRIKEATATLAWLRRTDPENKQVLEELAILQQQEEEAEATKKESMKSIVADPTTFKAFRIALTVVLAQEICGVFTMLMFAGRIFETAGTIKLSTNQQTMLLGAMQLFGSIVASCTVEKIGRKPLLASTGYIVSACMFTLGVWFYLNELQLDLPRWIPIAAMCLGIFCDSAGLQPVPYVIMSELFNFELRGMVSAAVMGATDLANFTELKIFHPIANSMGIHSCFWIFTTITFVFATYTVICVPETMGKTVDEIFEVLRGKPKPAKVKSKTNEDVENNKGISATKSRDAADVKVQENGTDIEILNDLECIQECNDTEPQNTYSNKNEIIFKYEISNDVNNKNEFNVINSEINDSAKNIIRNSVNKEETRKNKNMGKPNASNINTIHGFDAQVDVLDNITGDGNILKKNRTLQPNNENVITMIIGESEDSIIEKEDIVRCKVEEISKTEKDKVIDKDNDSFTKL